MLNKFFFNFHNQQQISRDVCASKVKVMQTYFNWHSIVCHTNHENDLEFYSERSGPPHN